MDPWSRSKGDRFAGPGSLYKSATPSAQQSGAKETTPRKTPSKQLPPGSDRYATMAERAVNTTTSSSTATSTYTSTTDRFMAPGGVYGKEATPGVGSYESGKLAERVTGAVRLQKAIRRRQSRGIFAQVESRAREMPAPGSYNPFSESIPESGVEYQGSKAERFAGPSSIYTHESTPEAGMYDPAHPRGDATGSKSAFCGNGDRFVGLNSIYNSTEAPGAGTYDVGACSGMASIAAASSKPSAAYRNQTDRFEGPNSLYNTSDAPGVGAYDYSSAAAKQTASSATYVSKTDRFNLTNGVYAAAAAATPGAGTYDIMGSKEKVRGAVKLQKAIRRRQSRGIFAQVESRAREMPSPGSYASEMVLISEGPSAAFKASSDRFTGQSSMYAHGATPSAGDYEPSKPHVMGTGMPSAIARSNTSRFEGQASIYAGGSTPSKAQSSKGTATNGIPLKPPAAQTATQVPAVPTSTTTNTREWAAPAIFETVRGTPSPMSCVRHARVCGGSATPTLSSPCTTLLAATSPTAPRRPSKGPRGSTCNPCGDDAIDRQYVSHFTFSSQFM